MKCFNHVDADAVGICKGCNKALCKECLIDVDNNISCKETCPTSIKEFNQLVKSVKTMQDKTSKVYQHNALGLTFVGLVFVFIGICSVYYINLISGAFIMSLGTLFLLWAFFNFLAYKRYTE